MGTWLPLLVLLCLVSGFPGTGVADDTSTAAIRPVAVEDFAIDPALVRTDPGPGGEIGILAQRAHRGVGILHRREKSPEQLASQVVNLFGDTLTEELVKAGIPASRFPAGVPLPPGGLVIQGRFLKVDQGSATKQATIGFGSGAPSIEVAGTLSDLKGTPPTPLLQFGGTNPHSAMPGGLVMLNPVAMGAKFVLAGDATEKDVKKLAVRMAGDIVTFLQGGTGAHPTVQPTEPTPGR